VSHAVVAGLIAPAFLQDLGDILAHPASGRRDAQQITLADLTGIAAQDIAMANAVLTAWEQRHNA
jgi:ornithine cyclodeaminase